MTQLSPPVKSVPRRVFIADRGGGGDPLAVAAALPRGTAVILRDYAAPDRAAFGAALARIARRRGLILLVAGDAALARRLGAQGLHLPRRLLWRRKPVLRPGWLLTAAVHDRRALRRAEALDADAVLLSPVFATRSHPGGKPLGIHRFARLAAAAETHVIALGGLDARNILRLPRYIWGLAAISAFSDQKFRRVPR